MTHFLRIAALSALLLVGQAAVAQSRTVPRYDQFVGAEDVEVQYVSGILRFCQRQNLKGRICGQYTKIFGKTIFEVRNWWDVESFVQAYTGLKNIEVTGVSPGTDGASLVIYFRPAQ